jgi:hypothetical protein
MAFKPKNGQEPCNELLGISQQGWIPNLSSTLSSPYIRVTFHLFDSNNAKESKSSTIIEE